MLDFGEAVRRFYGNYANAEGRAHFLKSCVKRLMEIQILI